MRELLPARRLARTMEFTHTNPSGRETIYTATLGYYKDGRLGEVFINSNHIGSDADTAVRDAAIILSIALQYGVPAEKIREAMTKDSNGKPEGVIGQFLESVT